MPPHTDSIRLKLAKSPITAGKLLEKLWVSQPTLSRAIKQMGDEVVRIGAARSIQYLLRDRGRGFDDVPVCRVDSQGRLRRLGLLTPVRPDGFVMRQDDGQTRYSEGISWWLLDLCMPHYGDHGSALDPLAALVRSPVGLATVGIGCTADATLAMS